MTIPTRLGFVGTGAITSAIVTGLSSSLSAQHSIYVSPRNSQIARDLAARYAQVSIASSKQGVLDASETVVLAVRPQVAREVLSSLLFRPDHRVISIVSSLSVDAISDLASPAARIVRAVPLPSAAERRSPTAIFPSDPVVIDLFAAVGAAFAVDTEREFDALCAATATIASQFAFEESIVAWLVRQGIPREKAGHYIARIWSGLALAAGEQPERTFQSLAADHATQGGINEQFLTCLEKQRVFENISEGLDAILGRIRSGSRLP